MHAERSWCSGSTVFTTSNSFSIRARPASPNRFRRTGSRTNLSSARANSSQSPGATSRPVTPSTTDSGIPASRVETTGRAKAIASMMTVGKTSLAPSESTTLANAKMSQLRSFEKTSAWESEPQSSTRRASFKRAIIASSFSRSGPSPTISQRKSKFRRSSSAQASSRISKPLNGTRRPILRILVGPGGRSPGREAGSSASARPL